MAKTSKPDSELELSNEEIDELVLNIPVSDRRLITTSADFSVGTLVTMLREKALVVPKFQRKYIWSERKASRLIESLILQCPIPVIYLNRRSDEILEVVDGNQRVTSLRRFIDGHFLLSGLTAYPELSGQSHDSLEQKFQRQIRNRTIRCVIIEPESNPQIKFDVFERLNSGSTPLSPQELRHGLYHGALVELLDNLATGARFISMTGTQNDKRMKRDELVLRFFAFSEALETYSKPLSSFLSDFLKANRDSSHDVILDRTNKFNQMIARLNSLLGQTAFRFRSGESDVRKFNTAYYDAISVGFATSALFETGPDPTRVENLRERVDLLAEDTQFKLNTLRATSDAAAITGRISSARDLFNEFA